MSFVDDDSFALREHAAVGTTVLDQDKIYADEFEGIRQHLRDSDGFMVFDELDGKPLTLPIWEDDVFLFNDESMITVWYIAEDTLKLQDFMRPWAYVQVLEHDELTYEEHELPVRNRIRDQDQLTVEESVDMETGASIRTDSDAFNLIEDAITIRYSLTDSDTSRAAGA